MLKPSDNLILGISVRYQAVAKANTQVASKVNNLEGRTRIREGECNISKRNLTETFTNFDGVVVTAWYQGHVKQLEKPSSPHMRNLWSKSSHITGMTRKLVEGERVADWSVVVMRQL